MFANGNISSCSIKQASGLNILPKPITLQCQLKCRILHFICSQKKQILAFKESVWNTGPLPMQHGWGFNQRLEFSTPLTVQAWGWDVSETCKSICDWILGTCPWDFKGKLYKGLMFDVCVLLLEFLFFAHSNCQKYNRHNVLQIMNGSNLVPVI